MFSNTVLLEGRKAIVFVPRLFHPQAWMTRNRYIGAQREVYAKRALVFQARSKRVEGRKLTKQLLSMSSPSKIGPL